MANPQLVRCMHSAADPASGGLALVHWLPDVPSTQLDSVAAELQSQTGSVHTAVCITRDGSAYVAESYAASGRPILFCGLGALAAGWVILNEHAAEAPTISLSNRQQSWQARRLNSAGADIALTYARPEPRDCAVPEYASACLGRQPIAAAEVGTASDYLILELGDAQAVQSLEVDSSAIVAASQRAFIVTARAAGNAAACVFRYFAPQYGDPEDAATGSAAVQLAAYWAPRLKSEQFMAQQLSAHGATMQLSCRGDVVELAARVGYG